MPEAIRLLEAKLKADPQSIHLHHILGELHERCGNDGEARKHFLLYRVKSLGFETETEAIAALEQKTGQERPNKMACLMLGEIFGLLKRFDDSEIQIQRGTTWEVSQSAHYRYHVVAGSTAQRQLDEITEQWEDNYQKILTALELPMDSDAPQHGGGLDGRINYYFYQSRVHKGVITGDSQLAHCLVDKGEVHVVHHVMRNASGLHEDCHALLHRFSDPVKLLDEGVALYLEAGTEMHQRFRDLRDHAYTIPQLLDDRFFQESNLFISYPQAGSFVGYLWQRFGIAKVKEACQYPDLGQRPQLWQDIFGVSLEQLETQWLQFLEKKH